MSTAPARSPVTRAAGRAVARRRAPVPVASRARSEKIDVTDTRVDGLALLQRQLQAREPLTALDAEQIRARRLALQAALQHGVDLVLGARARPHELFAAREATAQDPAALVGHPHRLKLALPQQAGQLAGVELVSLGPGAADPGV